MLTQNSNTSQIALGLRLSNFQPYTVLLAERSVAEVKLAKQYINAFEFKILRDTMDFGSVIEHFRRGFEKPDLVFLGYYVGGKDCIEVIEEIHNISKETEIVILLDELYRNEADPKLAKIGFKNIINKPITRIQFTEVVARILKRNELLTKFVDTTPQKKKSINLQELNIPPLPEVANKIIMFDLDPVGGSEKLEQIIMPDKGLSADILRVANSAYYGRSGKIKTLKDAITLLGLKLIKNIAIVQTKRAMHKNLGKDPVFKKVLIEKQILTSLIAFDISTPLGLKNLRDQVFTPANFLNAGMTIFALNRTEEYKKLLELHLAKKVEITEIESKAYGLSSKDIGLYVFKIWNMPEPIIDVMKNHGFKLDQLETVSDLDRLVRLGDILSRKMMELPVFEEEEEILKKIFEKYGAGEELLEAFGEDYFDMIQSHPFFEMLAF